jgi:hypothetical protein
MGSGRGEMALIRINAWGAQVREHGTEAAADVALAPLLRRDAPVIVMVHGFRYAPGRPGHCPHDHIFRAQGGGLAGTPSWPEALGIHATGASGLAFGWQARGSIWQAHAGAEVAGAALARVLRTLKARDPGREVHAIGHSLGARVILSAMRYLPAGALARVILLNAADHASAAQAALDCPAGRRARLLHVTSAENSAYDLALHGLVGSPHHRDAILGRVDLPGLATLRLNDPAHLSGLATLGYPVAAPERRVCHWSTYLRPGTFPLYRALMGPRGAALHAEVSAMTQPKPMSARAGLWSLPLPWGANPS